MKTAFILFPNQLFKSLVDQTSANEIYLVEESLYFNQFNFHKQKLIFHHASLKSYESFLQKKGFKVSYIESTDRLSDVRLLIPWLSEKGFDQIEIYDPVDFWLSSRIRTEANKSGVKINELVNPGFLEAGQSLEEWFAERKSFFQTDYYIRQRKRFSILVKKDNTPVGGKWTFDSDNRAKYPKNSNPPKIVQIKSTIWHQAAQVYIGKNFKNSLGAVDGMITYPIDHRQADKWLDDFLENRFRNFGLYEDAIVSKEHVLNHSLISPLLNAGLLTPEQVLKKTLNAAEEFDIPINSLEGFVRQILGWREFIRGVYIYKGRLQRTKNFWSWSRPMPASFYNGSTGILPVDDSIRKLLETGYNHHIERLMILGNFMLLCEIHPDHVYKWFMEMYIDAYDWVMVPNVYGMSQFADGGLMCTKPYISGSNYILKMSDYQSGQPWTQIWDALFWRFMDRQRSFFMKNPRMGMLVRTFDKMDSKRKKHLLSTADQYLEKL